MIVHEGRGDIFNAPERTRVCPINIVGAMGKGLALAFKRRYKGLYLAYLEALYDGGRLPYKEHLEANRHFQMLWQAEWEPNHNVLLVPTKLHWRDRSPLDFVEENLAKVVENREWLNVTDLAFPMMGCGEGGLDYQREVRPLMHKYFGESYPFRVGIYTG